MRWMLRSILLVSLTVGCNGSPAVEDGVPAVASGEEWLRASCDVDQRLDERIAALSIAGVVEVVGAQPFSWSFGCDGGTLQVDVRALDTPGDGDPILWLGLQPDPPRFVPIRLDVGSGQEELARRLAQLVPNESRRINVDLGTGVVWAP